MLSHFFEIYIKPCGKVETTYLRHTPKHVVGESGGVPTTTQKMPSTATQFPCLRWRSRLMAASGDGEVLSFLFFLIFLPHVLPSPAMVPLSLFLPNILSYHGATSSMIGSLGPPSRHTLTISLTN